MAVALALIMLKINWETENKHFKDVISTFLKVFEQ